jgi:hypothetical protein
MLAPRLAGLLFHWLIFERSELKKSMIAITLNKVSIMGGYRGPFQAPITTAELLVITTDALSALERGDGPVDSPSNNSTSSG